MATASLKHKNPINIAPLVDVLLILFVILIVAARFDAGEETKALKVELNNTKTAVEASRDAVKFRELLSKLNTLEQENDKLKNKLALGYKEKEVLRPEVKPTTAKKEEPKAQNQAEEIAKLKKQLRDAMSGNLQVVIDVYEDGIYINEKKANSQEIKTVFNKVYPKYYKLNFEKTPGAEAAAAELTSFLRSIGYNNINQN